MIKTLARYVVGLSNHSRGSNGRKLFGGGIEDMALGEIMLWSAYVQIG
jgi:hypothetical protein